MFSRLFYVYFSIPHKILANGRTLVEDVGIAVYTKRPRALASNVYLSGRARWPTALCALIDSTVYDSLLPA